jgi:hypothetical protein
MYDGLVLPHDVPMKQFCSKLCKFKDSFWIAPCEQCSEIDPNPAIICKLEYDLTSKKTIGEITDIIKANLPSDRFLFGNGIMLSGNFLYFCIGRIGCPAYFLRSKISTFEADVDYMKVLPIDWEHYQISMIVSGKTTYNYIKENETSLIAEFFGNRNVYIQSVAYGGKERAYTILFDIWDKEFDNFRKNLPGLLNE